jgi:hypothetical protein
MLVFADGGLDFLSPLNGWSFFLRDDATFSNLKSLIPARRNRCESLEFSWRTVILPFFFEIFFRVFSSPLDMILKGMDSIVDCRDDNPGGFLKYRLNFGLGGSCKRRCSRWEPTITCNLKWYPSLTCISTLLNTATSHYNSRYFKG